MADHLANVAETRALRRMLRRIAADELRHAELACRVLAFCVARDPGVLPALQQAFAGLIYKLPSLEAESSSRLERFGVPSTPTLRALARRCCEDIVGPCLGALVLRSAA